jgi:hypothetical protein
MSGCRVYWGSHGCAYERGHGGPCECECCACLDHVANPYDDEGVLCVAKPPYYGPQTGFYGEDVQARGLPTLKEAEAMSDRFQS